MGTLGLKCVSLQCHGIEMHWLMLQVTDCHFHPACGLETFCSVFMHAIILRVRFKESSENKGVKY